MFQFSVMPQTTTASNVPQGGLWDYISGIGSSWFAAVFIAVVGLIAAHFIAQYAMNMLLKMSGEEDETNKEYIMIVGRLVFIVLSILFMLFALATTNLLKDLGWIIGSLGLAIGLALQGVAVNFISGLIILLQKRTRLGDFISLNDGSTMGTIVEVGGRALVLKSLDGQDIIIPNKVFIESMVTTYTSNPMRRVMINMDVSYSANLDQVKEIIMGVVAKHADIEKEPAPSFLVLTVGANNVSCQLRFWVKTGTNWIALKSLITKEWFEALQAADVDISYPVSTLRVDKNQSGLMYKWFSQDIGPDTPEVAE